MRKERIEEIIKDAEYIEGVLENVKDEDSHVTSKRIEKAQKKSRDIKRRIDPTR